MRVTRTLAWGFVCGAVVVVHRADGGQGAAGASQLFVPAYVHQGEHGLILTLFPRDGPELATPLPKESGGFRVLAFSPDGRAFYGQKGNSTNPSALIKIEFNPPRQTEVPGSSGLGTIRSLTPSKRGGHLRALVLRTNSGQEAKYEALDIDPSTGIVRELGAAPWRGAGPISPVSDQMLRKVDGRLELFDLETNAVRVLLKGVATQSPYLSATWSPDGRWISINQSGSISLIDANDPSRRRKVGGSGGDAGVWSPDSKFLLFVKSQLSCLPTLYFESLEVMDVETGKKTPIKSAHCNVSGGFFGWLDEAAVR
jgi:hypothetical protein